MKQEIVATPPTVPTSPTFREYVDLVREDRATNRRNYAGFQALLAVRTGQLARSVRFVPLRKCVTVAYMLMQRRVRIRYGIEVHRSMTIGRRVRIVHQNGIVLHQWSVIGDDSMIRHGVTLGVTSGVYRDDEYPTLGSNVHVGAGASVVGRVVVGDNVRIGPNAVVMTDVPANSIVVAPKSRVITR